MAALVLLAGGACGPDEPEFVPRDGTQLTDAMEPSRVVVWGDSAFFTAWRMAFSSVWVVPVTGGERQVLVSGGASTATEIVGLRLAGDALYYTNPSVLDTSTLFRLALEAGGEKAIIETDDNFPIFTVHREWAYLNTSLTGGENAESQIVRLAVTDPQPEVLFTGTPAADITANDTTVAWISGIRAQATEVMAMPAIGGPATVLATDQVNAASIVADETSVYWTARGWGAELNGAIMRVDLPDGAPVALATGVHDPFALALDEDYVYFTTYDEVDEGTIRRVPKAGGAVVTLAAGQDGPNSVAVDATHVYWTNLGRYFGGAVMRTPKEP